MIKKKYTRLISFIMAIITVLTMLPSTVITALANTSSGQVSINNGSKYAVQWEYLYGTNGSKIYPYSKDYAGNTTGLGTYNMLKKYITTSSGGQKEPTSTVVPIYRVSRSNGDTNSDISATAVSTVNIQQYINLYIAAIKDGINIDSNQARMISTVLINTFKQFTGAKGTTQYYKDELYFLASQCILWEIAEGKRVGWGNESSYTGATSSNYPTNSQNKSRGTAMQAAYGYPSSAESKYVYYWHDYFYSIWSRDFSDIKDCPDYYDEILNACAATNEKFRYSVNEHSNLYFSENKNTAYDMTYNASTQNFSITYNVTENMLGSSYGLYDVNDIVLPISEKIINPKGAQKIYSLPSTSSKVLSSSHSGSIGVQGITKDLQFYYVRFNNTQYGYIPISNTNNTTLRSKVGISTNGNAITFTIGLENMGDSIYKIRWEKNVPNAFNEATYFSGAGEAVRGYISGGNQTEEEVYFNIKTPYHIVTFDCSFDCDDITIKVPHGAYILDSQLPYDHINSHEAPFKDWSIPNAFLNIHYTTEELLDMQITSDKHIDINYEEPRTITFDCSLCDEYETITAYSTEEITIPESHVHDGYKFKNWTYDEPYYNSIFDWGIRQVDAGFQSGDTVLMSDLTEDVYTARYDNFYTVEFVCGICGKTIETVSGKKGETYITPSAEHTHEGVYIDPSTGLEYSFDDLDTSFVSWDNNHITGRTYEFTANKTVTAKYDIYSDITITSHLYDEESQSEDIVEDWYNSVNNIQYQYRSEPSGETIKLSSMLDDKYDTTVLKAAANADCDYYIGAKLNQDFHILYFEVTDSHGNRTVYSTGDNSTYQEVLANVSVGNDAEIKIYWEPNDVQKELTINYVIGGETFDYTSSDNQILMTRTATVDYGEELDILNRKVYSYGSTDAQSAFEPYLTDGVMNYNYAGVYGFMDASGTYKQYNNDKTGTNAEFAELEDYKITSDTVIYIYYKPPKEGGIIFNLYASKDAGENAFNLAENLSSLKVYKSDSYIELNEIYITDGNSESTINPLLTEIDGYADVLQYTDNVNSEGYLPEDYPYVATIEYSPSQLEIGKYYYFVFYDYMYDQYYYTPPISGGVCYTGYEIIYDTVCDIGPVLQTVQVFVNDEDGNKYPAENATVIWENMHDYDSHYIPGVIAMAVYKIQYDSGKITKEEYLEKLNENVYGLEWVCSECGAKNTLVYDGLSVSYWCSKCHFNNEGLELGVGYVKTNAEGIATFYVPYNEDSFGSDYVFNVVDAAFYANGEEEHPSRFTKRVTSVYEYGENGSKGSLQYTSDNYDTNGNLIRVTNQIDKEGIFNLYGATGVEEGKDEDGNKIEIPSEKGKLSVSGTNGWTVLDLYDPVWEPIKVNVSEVSVSSSSYVSIENYKNAGHNFILEVFDDNSNKIDTYTIPIADCESEWNKVNTYSFDYVPKNGKGHYSFSLSISDVDDSELFVSPDIEEVYYIGASDNINFEVEKNIGVNLCIETVFYAERSFSSENLKFISDDYNLGYKIYKQSEDNPDDYILYDEIPASAIKLAAYAADAQMRGDSSLTSIDYSSSYTSSLSGKTYDISIFWAKQTTFALGAKRYKRDAYNIYSNTNNVSYDSEKDRLVPICDIGLLNSNPKDGENCALTINLKDADLGNYLLMPTYDSQYTFNDGNEDNAENGIYKTTLNNQYFSVTNGGCIASNTNTGWSYVLSSVKSEKISDLSNLEAEFIQPNANYNYGTEVVSTFIIHNNTNTDYDNTTAYRRITADLYTDFCYTVDGKEKVFVAPSCTTGKEIVVPAQKSNICYFKWEIPDKELLMQALSEMIGVSVEKIEIKSLILRLDAYTDEHRISTTAQGEVPLTEFCTSEVEKEGYNLDGGEGYTFKQPTADKDYANVGTWQEYIYTEENGFELITNTVRLGYESNLLRPHEDNPTKEVRDGQWVTKSGYALSTLVEVNNDTSSVNTAVVNNAVTGAQTAMVYYPEYNYSSATGKCEALVLNEELGGFVFRDVTNASTTKSRHYSPVWYPNTDYYTQTLISNVWTPAGMLSYLGNSNKVKIDGSLFDNYNTKQTF